MLLGSQATDILLERAQKYERSFKENNNQPGRTDKKIVYEESLHQLTDNPSATTLIVEGEKTADSAGKILSIDYSSNKRNHISCRKFA